MSADQVSVSNPPTAPATAAPASGGLRTGMFLGLALSLIGGAAAWAALERVDPSRDDGGKSAGYFQVDEKFHIKQLGAPEEKHIILRAEQAKVDRLNAALYLTIIGALLAVGLGLAETISRRSMLPILCALPVGAAIGAGAGLCGFAVFQLCNTGGELNSVESVAKVQAAMLAVLGIGVGLGVGLSTKSLRTAFNAAVGGAVAGGLSGLLFAALASFVLPGQGTERLISSSGTTRLLWLELTAGLLAVVTIGLGRQQPSKSPQESVK